ncbi:TRAP transporter large permease subunit [Oceanimonas baumannii]|uniref:C4-dicarboxylate ABC transporter substrate-binding protein n=1 Tax=Oceanimonas baumannii TaxID=129578 RepID=A0A235CML4_9GAMM|nr:TRAP transporter large permease subunit [Oceanimonas baumannii]OYD25811.1 C4-dicarboxylate ABC transporter substrate-binding protein [Oceanimonas baumannii]TDW60176.1 C4-dicarboxylate transporter DctM subunit [Oceanimonas baumannii]
MELLKPRVSQAEIKSAYPLANIFNNVEKPFLFIGLIVMIFIINYQTFFRYGISTLLELIATPGFERMFGHWLDTEALRVRVKSAVGWGVWTEELARYIFIWISYLAVSLSILNRGGIRVDVLHNRLSAHWQNILWVMIDFCTLILVCLFAYMGLDYVRMQLEMPQTTPALQIGYYIPYLILPVGFGLMGIRTLQALWRQSRGMTLPSVAMGMALSVLLFLPVMLSDDWSASLLLFGYFTLFLVLGVPIAFALGLAGLTTVLGAGTLPVDYLAQIAFSSIDSFPIMAIPFFIAAGVFMGAGGLSRRLLALGDELVGALPGGMALASIMTCIFFASISGSGPATVAAIGSITIPAMIARGYDKYFAATIVACAGAIGVIIPPSNPFVVYGVSAQVSIGKLFIAGIIPGLIMGAALMLVAYLISRKNGWHGEIRERSLKTFMCAAWQAKWALMVPVIVLGGIYGGIMTPTEAAAVAALYGLIVGLFVHRELSLSSLWGASQEAANISSIIIVLMAMATIFGNIMTIEQIPEIIAEAILALTSSKLIILIMINIFLLWIGIFMEALAAIVILTPILLPLVTAVGVNPVHFGVIMVMNLAIGFITPPVGVNLFVASGIANVSIGGLAKAVWVYLLVMIAVLLMITYLPEISLLLL